jgi:hypothetical protein
MTLMRISETDSSNIDTNGVNSAVEGSASEMKGATETFSTGLGDNISTVANSLVSSQTNSTLSTGLGGATGTDLGLPPWPNELEKYASVNYIFTLSCLTVDELNRPDSTYKTYGS